MTKRSYRDWTPEEDARLLAMAAARVVQKQIAYQLDRTTQSIKARLKVLRRQAPQQRAA